MSTQQLIKASDFMEHKNKIREFKVEVKWCKYSLGKKNPARYKVGTQFKNLVYEDIIFLNSLINNISDN